MTREKPGRQPAGRLDRAIDAAVRDTMAFDARSDLRARVLARLEQPAPAGVRWSPARVAVAGAALVVMAIAVHFAWPSRPAPRVEPDAAVTDARPAPSPPSIPEARPTAPPRETPRLERAAAEAVEPPSEGPERTGEPEPYTFSMPRLVEALEAPPVVVIEPLVEPHLAIEPVAIDRLHFEPVVIDPLRSGL